MKLYHFICKVTPVILFICANTLGAQTSYDPDEVFRTSIRKSLWQELKPKTPKRQRFMSSLVFNTNECFNLYEKAAGQRGWKPYELPTVAAFYQIILKETIAGKNYTEAEISETYHTVKSNYTTNGLDSSLDNKALQNKYDTLIIQALWISTAFELAQKNSSEIQDLAQDLLAAYQSSYMVKPKTLVTKTVEPAEKKQTQENSTTVPTSSNSIGDVKDIILRTVTKYGLNGVYVDNEVSILYNNGDVFTSPSKPLDDFDIALSKQEHPKKWRTFKKKGSVLQVYDPRKRKAYDWKKWFKVRSGTKNLKLSGKFNTVDAFGGATVVNASTVVFDDLGRFAWKTIKGGNTVWKPVYSKSDSSGTYRIDNYRITLRYNNGVTESFFFGLYPKDNEHFIIGRSHFVPAKK